MLKKLYVDNFKALNNFEISFNPVTLIIGANAAGKSTILNAIVFLKYCCTDSVNSFMGNHRLSVDDLCSKFSDKRTISLSAHFDFAGKEVIWEIKFSAIKEKKSIQLRSDVVKCGGKTLLHYSSLRSEKSYRIDEIDGSEKEIMRGNYKYSIISTIDSSDSEIYPTLCLIKDFFVATEPFDLLSPKDMRDSARGNVSSIGRYGEKLAAFIKNLNDAEKHDLVETVQSVFPNVSDIKATVSGRPGWAHIEVDETYDNKNISVSSRNISDGIIRMIAFFTMKYHKNSGGVSLLDEIENGINSEIMEPLFKAFQKNSMDNKQQFIATTHNTVLLDFIEPDNIRYIARDEQGNTIAYNPFENTEMKEKLGYMYPGEIILNTPNEQLTYFAKHKEGEN